ncbi:hypothetical protein DPMN_044161 [Dreissena polymorpha]|uniref:Uncharacterized protein n=2 Tax=Dreissena polymorpha TaxID=45954 RepID=A0A9D4D5B8_DREPO|nr:hypothetical protein DPMN_044161 [Dreissena polymorpha]
MLTQKGSNDLVVNTEHNTSMLTQKGSNDLVVNTEHNTSLYDLVVNTLSTLHACLHRKAVMTWL